MLASLALAGGIGHTQPATVAEKGSFANKQGMGIIRLQANLGSFRSIDGQGKFDVAFHGTVLISGLEGKVTPQGAVRRELNKYGREVYFGKGRLVIEGKWRAIQWFGSNMKTTWYGQGLIRILGEFDRNLKTGTYWYEDPADSGSFPVNGLLTLTVPETVYGSGATPRRRGG